MNGPETARAVSKDSVEEAEWSRVTVGFARLAGGEELEISFPYDEVLVLTRGVYVAAPPRVDADHVAASAG